MGKPFSKQEDGVLFTYQKESTMILPFINNKVAVEVLVFQSTTNIGSNR